ncbi:hypothetical protein ACCS52_26365 [Rhizobium ruizarguesonis]
MSGMINPWMPEPNAVVHQALGKLGEEVGELSQIVARCLIQGFTASEPVTLKANRDRTAEEIVDVEAAIQWLKEVTNLGIHEDWVEARRIKKLEGFRRWQAMIHRISARLPPDRLPHGHVVLEQAENTDGRVSQTVRRPDGSEYERIVDSEEAYAGDDAGEEGPTNDELAAIGQSVMNWIDELTQQEGPLKDWTPAESPTEIIPDLYNMLEESLACHRQACGEAKLLAEALEAGATGTVPAGFRWIDKPITVADGDYTYAGQLLLSFPKEEGGAIRYIVRDHNRRLFIHNAQQCGLDACA